MEKRLRGGHWAWAFKRLIDGFLPALGGQMGVWAWRACGWAFGAGAGAVAAWVHDLLSGP